LATTTLKQAWKNEYFQTVVMIFVIVVIVFGFWFGSQALLSTQYPALAVASGSMCKLPGSYCDGWTHPFERTLHTGDLIILQGVAPENIKAAPEPDGDVIVFRDPSFGNELIVHRAIEKVVTDDEIFFRTKGDGNDNADAELRPASNVFGKVVMRIPWVGHLALYMRNSSGIYIVAVLIILLVIIEFIVPAVRGKKSEPEPEKPAENATET